jgi:hypothetical protein
MNSVDKILQKNEVKPHNKSIFQLQHPFRALSCGRSGSGKSYWVLKNIVLSPNSPFDKVVWLAPEFSLQQSKLQEAKKVMKDKLVLIPDLDVDKLKEIIDNKPKNQQMLIVLDDLINKVDSPIINDLFTSGRHNNISTIEILQQVYAGKNRRQRLNSNYFILHDFPDKSEIQRLLQQLEPKNYKKIMDAYEQAIKQHDNKGCMIVDTNSRSMKGGELLKYRNNDLDSCFLLE